MPIEFADGSAGSRLSLRRAIPGRRGRGMLASNESCFAPLPEVWTRPRPLIRGVPTATRTLLRDLRRPFLSAQVAGERIALGNGSCDILLAAGEALLEPESEVIYRGPPSPFIPTWRPPRVRGRHRGCTR